MCVCLYVCVCEKCINHEEFTKDSPIIIIYKELMLMQLI